MQHSFVSYSIHHILMYVVCMKTESFSSSNIERRFEKSTAEVTNLNAVRYLEMMRIFANKLANRMLQQRPSSDQLQHAKSADSYDFCTTIDYRSIAFHHRNRK